MARIGRPGWLTVAVRTLSAAILFACAGCHDQALVQRRQAARQTADEVRQTEPPTDYLLQPGDEIAVKFFYNPELNEEMPIRPDGRIALGLVGEVQAAALTVEQLRRHIADKYAGTLRRPEVHIVVKSFGSQRVYVGGEVRRPGVLVKPDGMSALQAIVAAGGFLDTAEASNVAIVRDQGTPEPLVMLVDLHEGLNAFGASKDLVLRPKDIVYVPKTQIAEANRFVDQYIEKLLPISRGFVVSYQFGEAQ